jgi:hypothetical protein
VTGWQAAVIVLGVAARLVPVGGLPLDHHRFRQFDTSAMARNFAEGGLRLGYPQVDWGGDTLGYVESEFPLYAYLVALGPSPAPPPRPRADARPVRPADRGHPAVGRVPPGTTPTPPGG